MLSSIANELVGGVKEYPLIKFLLKSLPNILTSLYAWAVLFSFCGFDWVKYTADSTGIKVISEALNLVGINLLVGPVNDFISGIKNGNMVWIPILAIYVLVSSTSFYLRDSTLYIKDYRPENKYKANSHMLNPSNPVYALTFSLFAAIDWMKISGFSWLYLCLLIIPFIMIFVAILSFLKNRKNGTGIKNVENNKVPISLVFGSVLVPILVSVAYTPAILFFISIGAIDAERSNRKK